MPDSSKRTVLPMFFTLQLNGMEIETPGLCELYLRFAYLDSGLNSPEEELFDTLHLVHEVARVRANGRRRAKYARSF